MKKLILPLVIFLIGALRSAHAQEPTIQTQIFVASQGNCNQIDLSFLPGNGSRRLIIGRADSAVSAFPNDGTGYSSGSFFGTGQNLGNGNYVVYSGSGSSTTVFGLGGGREYFFAIFEYNGNNGSADYLTTGNLTVSEIAPGFTMAVSSSSGDMCRGDSVILEAHGADTYAWSPSTGLSSTTDSIVYAKPTNNIQYTVQGSDASGCTDSKTISITVYQNPNVNLGNFSNRCENSGEVILTSGSPAGGTYSGDGVSQGHFDPDDAGPGQHQIYYTYSDIHGCTSTDSSQITILVAPNASLSSFSDVCVDAGNIQLSGGTPTGGNYSGPAVSGNQFSPSLAGVGTYTISYIVSATGCSDTATASIQVRGLPNVSFSNLSPVCLNTPQFALTGGSPSGGTYSGSGVTNGNFAPLVTGAGNFILTYTYNDSHGCSNSDTSLIHVNTLPSVSLASLPTVCQNYGPVSLTGGSPAGGTYSGTGVGGTTFYSGIAGPGNHVISYTYTNSNGCSNSAADTLTVNAAPAPNLGPDQTICANASAFLQGGVFTSYSWTGGANTQFIEVDTTGRGFGSFTFILLVTNSANCANRDTVVVTFDNCTAVEEIAVNDFVIYPNPTASEFIVQSRSGGDMILYNLQGDVVLEKANVPEYFSFGETLPAGSYFLQITTDRGQIFRKLLKN